MNLLRLLQTIDRRFLYALLILAVALPFFLPIQLPVVVSPATEALYDAIEEQPAGNFALVAMDWTAGTRGENGPQTLALIRHLMRKRQRFALLCFDPQSATLGEEIATGLEAQFDYQEGRDWVNLGYQADMTNYLKSFVLDVPGQVKADYRGTLPTKLSVLHGIRSAKNIQLLIVITPTNSYQSFIAFVAGPYSSNMKMGVALTAVMAPEAFNYLDSKQIVGIVPGLQGAAEYETRYARQYDPKIVQGSRVTQYSNSSSFAHLLIIGFILMGNIAMLLERRQAARSRSRGL